MGDRILQICSCASGKDSMVISMFRLYNVLSGFINCEGFLEYVEASRIQQAMDRLYYGVCV